MLWLGTRNIILEKNTFGGNQGPSAKWLNKVVIISEQYIPTSEMIANFLTKPEPPERCEKFMRIMGVHCSAQNKLQKHLEKCVYQCKTSRAVGLSTFYIGK